MEVNPMSVEKEFNKVMKSKFGAIFKASFPSKNEKEIALLLYERFIEITEEYQIIDENINDYDLSQPQSQSSTASSQSLSSPKDSLEIEEKKRILNFIESNNWSFRAYSRRFPSLKHPSYISKWKKQVTSGGTKRQMLKIISQHVQMCFEKNRRRCRQVHDMDLKKWAMDKAKLFPNLRFLASDTWLANFKKKFRIRSRHVTKLVSKHELIQQCDIQASAEDFRKNIKELLPRYNLSAVWNTDQVGFQYEYSSKRTLSFTGEKFIFGSAFSPKNRLTHSYTVQYIISAEGNIVGDVFLCLQEPSGRLGPEVEKNIFLAPNVTITCSTSGKLTSSHVSYFLEKVVKPAVTEENVLYIMDSWGGQTNSNLYSNAEFLKDIEFNVQVVPPNCTPLVQPLDLYFNLQLKYLIKKIYDFGQLNDIRLTSRDDVIKLQSLAHFLLSSPRFKNMITYCFKKAGLLDTDNLKFDNVKELCFELDFYDCQLETCENSSFIKCSWCRKCLCFDHFYFDFHVYECIDGPYLR